MRTILRCGTILGLLVAVYTAIVSATGTYTNNLLAFWGVLLLQFRRCILGPATNSAAGPWLLESGARGHSRLRGHGGFVRKPPAKVSGPTSRGRSLGVYPG